MRKMTNARNVRGPALLIVSYFAVILAGCREDKVAETDKQALPAIGSTEYSVPGAPWPTEYSVPTMKVWDDVTRLSPDDIRQLMRQAYAGDPRSAVIVAEFTKRSESLGKDAEAWRHIAAENGDVPSMIDIAWNEQLAGGEQHCLRAKFWLERAAVGQAKLPVSPELKNPSPAEEVGLYGLRDNWDKCLAGHAAAYLGVAPINND